MATPHKHAYEVWQFFELYTPGGTTIYCRLFRTESGLELRLQRWSLPAERVQSVNSFGDAKPIARQWFEEVTTHDQHHFSRGVVHGC
jgi:hypothetical protein